MKVKPLNAALISTSLVALLLGGATISYGQQDPILSDTQDYLDNEQIDVDGTFKKKQSAADKLAEMRRKLEEKNEDMMQKKIEDMRINEEMKLTQKLQDAFTNGINNVEQPTPVNVVQTVPPAKVEAEIEKVIIEPAPKKSVKVIPTAGMMNISGDRIDFDSKFSGGVMIEGVVSDRFSVGIGFNYATLKIKQIDNSAYNTWGGSYYYPTVYPNYVWNDMYDWRNRNYGPYRELDYKQLTISVNSKFFFTVESRVRPYAGLGLSANRATLSYSDSEEKHYQYPYNNNYGYGYDVNGTFGDEKYKATYFSGSVALGAEVNFTDNFGMMLEGSYARSLSTTGTKSEASFAYNLDQQQLDKIGKSIGEADFISVNLGVVVSF